jgi:hypothetical protein
MSSCYGCGKCCEAIQLNLSMKDMVNQYKGLNENTSDTIDHDTKFVYNHMKYISPVELWHIDPDAKIWGNPVICDQFDKITRICKSNLIKPFFCDRYLCDKMTKD